MEALPYIRSFHGKTVVVKYGGAAMRVAALRETVAADIILMHYVGMRPVVVHGGGPEVTSLMARLGKEASFVDGLRVTDAESAELVEMVLVGKVNRELVTLLNRQGGRAVGLSGKDGNTILARRMVYVDREGVRRDLGHVGEVAGVDPSLLLTLTRTGYIPVLSPVAAGDHEETLNCNADAVAGEVAAALGAEKLVVLTDVEGIREEPGNPESVLSSLAVDRAERLIAAGTIRGGMIPKVRACARALSGGVNRAHIVDGRIPHALLLEVFTRKGIGTMVEAGEAGK